ncbi:MAG: TIGR01548 family HAD-type hydrolase [Leptolyngbya sp.]|nr:TIGR01548 family HAD-type hydrolase [Leptolyngbya sp.]
MTWQAIAVFDIDGVIRDVGGSYRRALADTVEHFTQGAYRPSPQAIDTLKAEGIWNNDWEGAQELVYRHFEGQGQDRTTVALEFDALVDFFQRRYRGPNLSDPSQWTGYITQEPLLVQADYFTALTAAQVAWGFFSGATRGSAQYVLERRLGLAHPVLVAMEDAPGKPDPTGLFQVVDALAATGVTVPVIYAGDTVADMETIRQARQQRPQVDWLAVGIVPPHVNNSDAAYRDRYCQTLRQAGADTVLFKLTQLTGDRIQALGRVITQR